MTIEYKINEPITTEQFIQLLKESTLGDRRPIDDYDCMAGMVEYANLTVTAWKVGEGEPELVGVARSITDFYYACYLSDLAVSEAYQKQGIGIELQRLTQSQLGPQCKLILIAAPAARDYYGHIGYTHIERCWALDREAKLES